MQQIPLQTGYCLFCKEIRETVREELGTNSRLIVQELANRWKKLPENQKQEWRAKAEKINQEVREENVRRKIKREEARLNRIFSPKFYILSD